jgi:hypothetical protein
MHMAVLETRDHHAAALRGLGIGRDGDSRAFIGDADDASIADEHGALRQRRGAGCGVDLVGRDEQRLGDRG